MDAFLGKASEFVTGDVRVTLFRGTCQVTGLRSEFSIYSQGLANPNADGQEALSHESLKGFVDTISQPLKPRPSREESA